MSAASPPPRIQIVTQCGLVLEGTITKTNIAEARIDPGLPPLSTFSVRVDTVEVDWVYAINSEEGGSAFCMDVKRVFPEAEVIDTRETAW